MTGLGSGGDPTEGDGDVTSSAWREDISGTRIGRYLLLDRIGAGGMGVVWRAYDPMLDRRVALKLVASRGGDPLALVSEAQALARLQHPNIVAIHDVGPLTDGLFLAMEYVDGVTLTRHLQLARTWREVVDVFLAVAQGVRAAHAAGVVHGDLKPDNVLVAAPQPGVPAIVKVVDFGLASMAKGSSASRRPPVSEGSTGASRTDLAIRGTPAYLAPEQVAGAPASERTDQYAFCVAMFEALTGARPRAIDSLHTAALVFRDARTVRWPAGHAVPPWLRRIVLTGLAIDPAARHGDFDEIVHALQRGRTRLRRRAGLLVASTAVIAGAVALVQGAVRCADADAPVTAVWSDGVAAEMQSARGPLSAGELDLWRRRHERLDATAADLAAASRRACEGRGSAESRRRQRCVDHGLATLELAVAQARGGDVHSQRFVLAGVGLDALEPCDDEANLQQFPPIAEDLELRAAVQALERDIAVVNLAEITSPELGDATLAELGRRAQALGEEGLYTDVLLLRARAATAREEDRLKLELLRDALASAEASRDDRRVALAWHRIAAAQIGSLGDETAVRIALERMDAASARLGRPADLEAHRHRVLAQVANARGERSEAVQALATMLQAANDAQRPDLAFDALLLSVSVNLNASRVPEALASADAAVALARSAFGEDHPDLAIALGARAGAMLASARGGTDADFDRANAAFDDAIERLTPWEQQHAGVRRALECNRCVGLTDACRSQATSACVRCGELSLDAMLTSASQRTLSVSLGSLALSDPAAAVPLARAAFARWREDARSWRQSTVPAWAALVLAWAGDREPGLELFRDVGNHGRDSTAAYMLDAWLATQDDDRERRGAVRVALETNVAAEDLRDAERLVRAWFIAQLSGAAADREAVAHLRGRTAIVCSPGWRPRIDAWLANEADAPSALAGATATVEAVHDVRRR
ncbi:MAG: serine/threonine protein kinase [Deltaproteobacteria bacterium]|nr:serine/threonine protein kinase [Deltaproteobacteria bacterium]